MKAVTALILVSVIVGVSVVALPVLVYGEPSVGVREGDWIEYDVGITGTGAPPPTHDVTWMRITILPVQGAAFSANVTTRYSNGTVGSAVWEFNFTEGNVEGWIIIPAGLGAGDTFFDNGRDTGKPVDVAVQREEQKTVLGASRVVTYGNDSFRHKEWDKATGVFVGSSEHLKNVTNKAGWYIEDLTVTVQAIATNMWSATTILGLNPLVFYALVAVVVAFAVLMAFSMVVVARRKRAKGKALSGSVQWKIVAFTVVAVVVFELGTVFFFPFSAVGLSFAEINLVMQTIWSGMVFMSMWFRVKGEFFVHEVMLLIVICAWWVGFSTVLLMNPFSTSTEAFSSSLLRLVMNGLHGVFSVPALVFGTWLVALWRPKSESFAAKSRRMALLTVAFWIPSYVVGFLDFLLLHTAVFG